MKKFIILLLAILEFVLYTFLMVLVESITIENNFLKIIVHLLALALVAVLIYYLYKFILKKLKYFAKTTMYMISIINLVFGLIFPCLLIILIPNEKFTIFATILLISTIYYGVIINIIFCILNHFLTKQ